MTSPLPPAPVSPAAPAAAAFPTASATLTLSGPAGALEVAVDRPDAEVAPLPLTVVLCHPLSTEGGSLNNKVVTMAARSLRELGANTVRFNFRGVGGSEGSFDQGNGEQLDLLAVVAWVRQQRPDDDLWLAGFSFGAYVSLRASDTVQPDALISIAPPAGRWDFDSIVTPTCPWLVIQGDTDEIVDPQAVYAWIDTLKRKPELVRMPDTSHFFHRKLIDLRGALQHGVRPWLPLA
ncbi:alpha/beta fold hydrolase [Pseudoxanthomonas gei]|uniref:Alpha/beta fold hydrolase n=1 Tax=Pseudoxanthomonas gei TaxID=1383030 RepID=A0ABX0AH77_9GAMM|nr:alpha/beta fold hydrolase [Pseudoxanthomonas gei]NDK39480.1 alpha/beta fold hydrolase [Pseudoxanthomonas gei]